METTTIAKIYNGYEKMIHNNFTINGRVKSVRDSKTFGFIELNDGTYLKNIQVVFDDSLANFAEICKFTTGSAISVA